MSKPAPDDTEVDQMIAAAEDLGDALWYIAEKYGAEVTNNEERWQERPEGPVYLRHVGDFMEDVRAAARRFPEGR